MGRMDHGEVGGYWDRNADSWIELSRAGYDVYRDLVNTPAFLAMLPDVTGSTGLDLGCGEGHNTRLLARRGARMRAIDLAWRFLEAVVAEERREPARGPVSAQARWASRSGARRSTLSSP
jgi:trans-aconitate methyltransferase